MANTFIEVDFNIPAVTVPAQSVTVPTINIGAQTIKVPATDAITIQTSNGSYTSTNVENIVAQSFNTSNNFFSIDINVGSAMFSGGSFAIPSLSLPAQIIRFLGNTLFFSSANGDLSSDNLANIILGYQTAPPPFALSPTFSPTPGLYTSPQTVTINDGTAGTTIYYTLNSATPTINSTLYTGPLSVNTNTTILAIAVGSGLNNSNVSGATYNIAIPIIIPPLPNTTTPVFNPGSLTYQAAQTVSISVGTAGANIYFTVDGSNPSNTSTRYTTPISLVGGTTVIKAMASANGYANSAVATATYTSGAAVAPVISPPSGSFITAQTITLSSVTQPASIYYTANGVTPNAQTTLYNLPFLINSNTTIKAIVLANGYQISPVTTATYTTGTTATPVISPGNGNYLAAQTVSITDATTGAVIYYTIDNSTPSISSTKYTTNFIVASNTTVKAIALSSGYANSNVTSATITIAANNAGNANSGGGNSNTSYVCSIANATYTMSGAFDYHVVGNYCLNADNYGGIPNYNMWVGTANCWGWTSTASTEAYGIRGYPSITRGWTQNQTAHDAENALATNGNWTTYSGMGIQLSALTKARIKWVFDAPLYPSRWNGLMDCYFHDHNNPAASEFYPLIDILVNTALCDQIDSTTGTFYSDTAKACNGFIKTLGGNQYVCWIDQNLVGQGGAFNQPGGHTIWLGMAPNAFISNNNNPNWGSNNSITDLHAIIQFFMQSNPTDDSGKPVLNAAGVKVTSPLLLPTYYLNAINAGVEIDICTHATNYQFIVDMQNENTF